MRIGMEPAALELMETVESQQTQAEREAQTNWQSNLRELRRTQPQLAEAAEPCSPALDWVYGRDGSLTGRSADGQWWGGCSLPQRAAGEQLRGVKVTGTACLVGPVHGAQIRGLLEMLEQEQAVIAVVPELDSLAVILRGCDVSRHIAGGRLWIASTSNWPEELGRILQDHPGLPVPGQFVKTTTLKPLDADGMMERARGVFQREEQRRQIVLGELRRGGGGAAIARIARDSLRVCVLAPTRFRLWNDAAQSLGDLLLASPRPGIEWRRLDPDQPCSSGELAIALAARECDCLVTANFTRSELGKLVNEQTPVVTWLTGPRIPTFNRAMANDALLLADGRWKQQALDAGWPNHRLAVARWPSPCQSVCGEPERCLGLIADTFDVSDPGKHLEWTSHLPLWELIADELRRDPFVLADVGEYLASRMKRLGTQDRGLDRRQFLAEVILPAYQQGLVKLLMAAGIAVKLFGRGWGDIPEFAPHACGEIESPRQLRQAAGRCAGLVHAWPALSAHAIESLGRPVTRAYGQSKESWLKEAERIASGGGCWKPAGAELSVERVLGFLR